MRKLLLIFCLSLITLAAAAQIAFFGDTRSNPDTHRQIVEAIVKHKPQIAFHTGDLNSRGIKQSEYDLFKKICQPLTAICPLYPARGNHERSLQLFLDNFPALQQSSHYTLVHDGIRFIILDSVLGFRPASPQYKWLQSALADTLPAILIMHHPVFSSGEHGDELGLQLFLPQLLKNSHVIAVFSGHDHNYERSVYANISYIVTGGGGAPLRETKKANSHSVVIHEGYHYLIAQRIKNQLSCVAYALDGAVLDRFTLNLGK